MRKYWKVALLLTGVAVLAGCAAPAPMPAPAPEPVPEPAPEPMPPVPANWLDTELVDVATGQSFRISDFAGKPVLLESFAVWCPTCLQQQRQIEEVLQREGEAIIHISLDTDPNEDAERVRGHIERHNFDWYFAVAPIEMSQALVDEFGLEVVSAPQAPVVLVCEDQSTRLLRRGVKSADDLIAEVASGCQ